MKLQQRKSRPKSGLIVFCRNFNAALVVLH
jgi:hypothetical protein